MVIKSSNIRVSSELDRVIRNIKIEYLKNGKQPPSGIKITHKIANIIKTNPKIKNELLKIR